METVSHLTKKFIVVWVPDTRVIVLIDRDNKNTYLPNTCSGLEFDTEEELNDYILENNFIE